MTPAAESTTQNGSTAPKSVTLELPAEKPDLNDRNIFEKTTKRPRKPNYREIHSKPLPLTTYPLPSFIPHNPLSLIHVIYTTISHFLFPPSSHTELYPGYFSAATRSVHVTDEKTVRAMWEMGFFGKGSLSRSEPTWLHQEKRRVGLGALETSEEATNKRRKEREKFKRDRARAEREALEEQLKKESALLTTRDELPAVTPKADNPQQEAEFVTSLKPEDQNIKSDKQAKSNADETTIEAPEVQNQEHLQLSLEEAFFLTYGLGVLTLPNLGSSTPVHHLLTLFRSYSYFPPLPIDQLSPDDPFLLNYVVYHHFRSLGWVVRDGIKFAVDYLLYDQGPVFKHAAFAIIIVPSYGHDYWQTEEGQRQTSTMRRKKDKSWTWMHCVNRVQTQVVKTLVLCYVDIPSPSAIDSGDVGHVLRQYKIREFAISRWSANRNRD